MKTHLRRRIERFFVLCGLLLGMVTAVIAYKIILTIEDRRGRSAACLPERLK